MKNYFRIYTASHTFATIYLRLDSGNSYRGMVLELGELMVKNMQLQHKPLKNEGKPCFRAELAFRFLTTVIVDWCTSIGSQSSVLKQMKRAVKMALFLSMPYLSRQNTYFETKGADGPVCQCTVVVPRMLCGIRRV